MRKRKMKVALGRFPWLAHHFPFLFLSKLAISTSFLPWKVRLFLRLSSWQLLGFCLTRTMIFLLLSNNILLEKGQGEEK